MDKVSKIILMAEKIIWLVPKISRNLIQTDQSERDHQSKGGWPSRDLGYWQGPMWAQPGPAICKDKQHRKHKTSFFQDQFRQLFNKSFC